MHSAPQEVELQAELYCAMGIPGIDRAEPGPFGIVPQVVEFGSAEAAERLEPEQHPQSLADPDVLRQRDVEESLVSLI